MGFGNALAYGLANGASGFAQMFTRAMEMADAHQRRMEELGLRRGPQLPPGVTGETDRDMRDENKQLGREFAAAVGAPKGVVPDVKYGTLPADEAAVLQQKRVLAPGAMLPDARGGRAFNMGFAEPSGVATPQELQRFQMANAANNRQVMAGPAFGAPIVGPFDRAMHAFRDDPAIREQMFPSARLDADIAASPFAQAMKDAGNRAALAQFKASGASPAKMVERAPQEQRGDLMGRIASLEPAAQAEAAGRIGAALNHFGQKARAQKMEDERSKAQMKAGIGVAASKTKATDRAEIDRQNRIAEAATQASAKLRDAGKEVTPEAVAALAGISPEEAASAIAKPRPVIQKSGELPSQRREKLALASGAKEAGGRISVATKSVASLGGKPNAIQINQVLQALQEKRKLGLLESDPTIEDAGLKFGLQPGQASAIEIDDIKKQAKGRAATKQDIKRYAAALKARNAVLGQPTDNDAIAPLLGEPFGLKPEEAAAILMKK